MKNNQNMRKITVYFFLTIFIIVIILTILSLFLYYLTPNNYIIEIFDESKYVLIEEQDIIIKSDSNIEFLKSDKDNIFFKFVQLNNFNTYIENINKYDIKNNDVQLLIKNLIKSQNIMCNQNELVKILYNSQIILINQIDSDIIIKILMYKHV